MIYQAFHGAELDGGSLRPVDDEFHPSNKEEEFLASPPEEEWLPLNKPSTFGK